MIYEAVSRLSHVAMLLLCLSVPVWSLWDWPELRQTPRHEVSARTSGANVGDVDIGVDMSLLRAGSSGWDFPTRKVPSQNGDASLQGTGIGEARWKSGGVRIGVVADSGTFGQSVRGLHWDDGVGGQSNALAVAGAQAGRVEDTPVILFDLGYASALRPALGVGRVRWGGAVDSSTVQREVAGSSPAPGLYPSDSPESQETDAQPRYGLEVPAGGSTYLQGVERSIISERSGRDGLVAVGNDPSLVGGLDGSVYAAGRLGGQERGTVGRLTYYHPSLAGNTMRDGVTRYDPLASGLVATNDYPLGRDLYICGPTGRCLWLQVRDTGAMQQGGYDVSEADFVVLAGSLDRGVAEISVRER